MALFKTNHYRIERNRVKQEENNGLTVTGVRVLLNTWCSKATEEQILSRIRDIMGDENEAPEKKICQRIEKLFENLEKVSTQKEPWRCWKSASVDFKEKASTAKAVLLP